MMAESGRKTILLVEDEIIIAMAEKSMLANHGFDVVIANTGEKAIEAANAIQALDLILMDIDLGKGIDGTQAAARILKDHRLPLVFLSSHTERDIVEKTEGISSYGYIVKNSGETVMIACINMAFKLFVAQEKYRMLVENSHDIIYTFTPDGVFTYVSQAWTDMLGHRPEEVVGHPFQEFVHEDDVPRCREWMVKLIETGSRRTGIEYRVRHADGSWLWHASSATPLLDHDGNIIGYEGIAGDISGRKQTEEALKKRESDLKTIFDAIDESICLIDKDGTVLTANSTFASRLGRLPEDCVGRCVFSLVPPEVAARRRIFVDQSFKTGEPMTFEDEREGHWLHQNLYPIRNSEGQTDRFVIYASDITHRRNIEEALRISEAKYRTLFEILPLGFTVSDSRGRIVESNGMAQRILGLSKEEHHKRTIDDPEWQIISLDGSLLAADEYASTRALRENRLIENVEMGIRKSLDDITWLNVSATPIPIEGMGVAIIYSDITNRKKMEEQLQTSESRFKSAFDYASIGKALVSPEGKWLKINRATCELLGYTESELMNMTFQDITHPDDLNADLDFVRQMLAGEIDSYKMEKRYIHKNGTVVWALLSVSLVWNAQGKPDYFISQIVDISARKLAEKALKDSEEKFRQIVTTAREGVWILDKDAKTTYVNRFMADMLGYEENEMTGKSLFAFMDAEAEKEAIILFERMSRGISENHDFRFSRKDGTPVWALIATNSILDEHGAFVAALGMVTDITERKKNETNITKLLKEKETLLRESHHRIKNNMNTLISLLSIQARSQESAAVRDNLETASGRIRAMMILYDKLYRADDTRELCAREFLPALVSEILRIFSGDPPVSAEVEAGDFYLDSKSMSVVGIMINELITNSVKYAFGGRSAGRIRILAKSEGDAIALIYEDDGIGLPAEDKLTRTAGFGMQLIEIQVQQLDGTMRISRENGTRFEIRFPHPKNEARTGKKDTQ